MRRSLALILAACLAAVAPPSHAADLVLRNKHNGVELRLLDAPCSHGETLGHLREEWRPKFKNARVLDRKGHIRAYGCWIDHDGEVAIVIFEDGTSAEVKLAAFSDPSV